MTITSDSPIIGRPSGTLADALEYGGTDAAAYVKEVWRLGLLTGLDPAVLIAQSAHETDDWTSGWWRDRLNPAGIGITGDPVQNAASQTWLTQTDAARGHVLHMLAYHYVPSEAVMRMVAAGISDAELYDFRYRAPFEAGYTNANLTLRDLTGRWATDPQYDQKIVRKHAAIFTSPAQEQQPVSELNMTKGLIPLPGFSDAIIDVSLRNQSIDCRGYDDLGWRADPPRFLILHRPQSPLNGSNEGYLRQHCCPALFEFEVNGLGQAKRFALRGNAPSGWANGRVSQPYGDALKYLEHYGWNPNDANQHGEALEVGGWFLQPGVPSHEDPITEEQRRWIAQWMASRAHDYGIPWNDFPIIPNQNGRSYITWHQEWTIGTGKVCPGQTLMAETPALIARAKEIMRAAQQGTKPAKPPVYALPELPSWWADSIGQSRPSDADWNGLRYRVVRRKVEAKKGAVRRSRPDTTAPKSGPNFLAGEKADLERVVTTEFTLGGKTTRQQWLVTQDGHYCLASSFTPRIVITSR